MPFLPAPLYATIEKSVPIICVDLIPVHYDAAGGVTEVGLILRDSPFGEVWCQLGGRVRYGETVNVALLRHLHETLAGSDVQLPADPQPDYVYQWFPDAVMPEAPAGMRFGRDPRKHAITMCYRVTLLGTPVAIAGGEGRDFRYWPITALPENLWPGCDFLIAHLTKKSTAQRVAAHEI